MFLRAPIPRRAARGRLRIWLRTRVREGGRYLAILRNEPFRGVRIFNHAQPLRGPILDDAEHPTTGCCDTPLSSSKTIQACRRRAFFLPAASAGGATVQSPRRPVPAPGGPAVAATNSIPAECARHGTGDT